MYPDKNVLTEPTGLVAESLEQKGLRWKPGRFDGGNELQTGLMWAKITNQLGSANKTPLALKCFLPNQNGLDFLKNA